MKKFNRFPLRLVRWVPALIVMGVIFWVSSTPGSNLPDFGVFENLVETGGHFLGYVLLAQAYLFAIGSQGTRSWWIAGFLAILYGISDEIHQSFVPGRDASIIDLGVDALGISLSLLARFLATKI